MARGDFWVKPGKTGVFATLDRIFGAATWVLQWGAGLPVSHRWHYEWGDGLTNLAAR